MSGMKDAFDNYMDMILSSGVNETSESIDDLSDFADVDQDLDSYRNIFTSKESFSGVDEEEQYSWREDYDYDFDHNIDPDDYETEEEYLEALEEAQIISTSVLPQTSTKISSPYKVGQTVLHDSFGIGNTKYVMQRFKESLNLSVLNRFLQGMPSLHPIQMKLKELNNIIRIQLMEKIHKYIIIAKFI